MNAAPLADPQPQPLLRASDCANGCGGQGRPGVSVYCGEQCKLEAFSRIDGLIWGKA